MRFFAHCPTFRSICMLISRQDHLVAPICRLFWHLFSFATLVLALSDNVTEGAKQKASNTRTESQQYFAFIIYNQFYVEPSFTVHTGSQNYDWILRSHHYRSIPALSHTIVLMTVNCNVLLFAIYLNDRRRRRRRQN